MFVADVGVMQAMLGAGISAGDVYSAKISIPIEKIVFARVQISPQVPPLNNTTDKNPTYDH
eukprot:1181624-Prorocentrum_minimum.AAC.4